jgi:HSP20 family protein
VCRHSRGKFSRRGVREEIKSRTLRELRAGRWRARRLQKQKRTITNHHQKRRTAIMTRIVRYTHPRASRLFPALANTDPWTSLESDFSRLFDAAWSDFSSLTIAPRFPVDIYEDKDNTYVRAELPGVNRDAINVEMVEGFLNISAARKEGDESFNLTRSVSIPESVQADKVSAAYENGVLTVTLPKQEQAKPRKINITIS